MCVYMSGAKDSHRAICISRVREDAVRRSRWYAMNAVKWIENDSLF